MTTDERFMAQAVRLAARGNGRTASPVGALVVRDGRVVGRGWHRATGQPHAEIVALRQAAAKAAGADLYVTLEPCSHQGRTPPCAPAVAAARPGRVIVGCLDPNPLVAGRGIAVLQAAGIPVVTGVLEARCRQSIEVHLKYIATGLPFVTLKMAQSLDGKVATATGESQWITGQRARALAHRLRAAHHAVLVGSGTVLADDCALNARFPGAHQPARVVLDGAGRCPAEARLLAEPGGPVLVFTTAAGAQRLGHLAGRAEVVVVPCGGEEPLTPTLSLGERGEGKAPGMPLDLPAVLKELGRRELASVLVEGGPTVAGAFVRAGLVDKFAFFTAPLVMGGAGSRSAVAGPELPSLAAATRLRDVTWRRVGEDWLVTAYPEVQG